MLTEKLEEETTHKMIENYPQNGSKWYGKSLQTWTWTSKTRPLFDDDLCDGRSVHAPRGGHYMLFADGPGVFEPHEFEARSVHGVPIGPIAGGAGGSRRKNSENRP